MKVYHIRNAPDGAVYIGRPSTWGNPFAIGKDGNREEVIQKFRCYAEAKLVADPNWLAFLEGKDLVCYCAPKACHGDVLIELVKGKLQ